MFGKYCNTSVMWVITMHQRAWCSFTWSLLLLSMDVDRALVIFRSSQYGLDITILKIISLQYIFDI